MNVDFNDPAVRKLHEEQHKKLMRENRRRAYRWISYLPKSSKEYKERKREIDNNHYYYGNSEDYYDYYHEKKNVKPNSRYVNDEYDHDSDECDHEGHFYELYGD